MLLQVLLIMLISLFAASSSGQSSLATRCTDLANVTLGAPPAPAPGDKAASQSEPLLREAAKSYSEQQFAAALDALSRAYAISPSAAILYNMAQACREGRAESEALAMYEYSARWTTNPALRTEALRRAAALHRKLARDQELHALAEHQRTLAATQQRLLAEQQAALGELARGKDLHAVASQQQTMAAAQQHMLMEQRVVIAEARRPPYKRWWFWTTLGGTTAVAVAVGIALANAYPQSPTYPNLQDVVMVKP